MVIGGGDGRQMGGVRSRSGWRWWWMCVWGRDVRGRDMEGMEPGGGAEAHVGGWVADAADGGCMEVRWWREAVGREKRRSG